MSTTSTVSRDNLLAGDYPIIQGTVTVAASQTAARGAVVGKVTIAAGTAAAGSNTGDGAISGFALAAGGPAKIGTYVATCVEAASDSGIFEVVDPDGILIGTLKVAGTFTGGGITFALADGSTDFIVGDSFNLPVEAGSGQVKLLDITATDGSQKFYGVLLEAVTTGSGETASAAIAKTGEFLSQGLTFGGSTVVADVVDDMRNNNCFVYTSHALENVQVS